MKRDTLGTLRARIAELEAGSPSIPNRSEVDTGKSGVSRTDAEVICTFMDGPRPSAIPDNAEDMYLCGSALRTPLGFWICVCGYDSEAWLPQKLTLNECHEVEARLTDEQWKDYCATFAVMFLPQPIEQSYEQTVAWDRAHLHASAEYKVRALAATLRSRVPLTDDTEGTQAIQEKRG